MKKVLSLLVVLVMIATSGVFPLVTNAQVKNKKEDVTSVNLEELAKIYDETESGTETFETTSEITDLDGSVIETVDTKVTTTVDKEDKKGKVTIFLLEEKTFTKSNGKEKTKTEKHKLTYTKDGEFTIDDEVISLEMLEQSIIGSDIETNTDVGSSLDSSLVTPYSFQTTYLSSGGKSWLTYYSEQRTNYYYLKAYKEPTNSFLDGGSGTPRTKYAYGSYKVTDFKNLARTVASARNEINIASATLAATLGVAAVGWWTVIALLGAGTGAAISAYTIYSASGTGKSAMKEAYYLLGTI